MRTVQLDLTIPDRGAPEVYATLADLSRYPEFSPAVRSVTVTETPKGAMVSEWQVAFRRGLLCWVEEDVFDEERHRIDFRQLQGDLALFRGSWTCADEEGGTRITFRATLDLGMPSLAEALEPIAVRTLVENTVGIVSGLFLGRARLGDVVVESPDASALTEVGALPWDRAPAGVEGARP